MSNKERFSMEEVMNETIRFPFLGLEFTVGKSITIFGINIAYYGIIIAIAMIVGALVAYQEAKRTHQSVDDYVDFTIFTLIAAIVGARLYYCIFDFSSYASDPIKIITGIRDGGLAIYGGIIASIITMIIFAKVKKMNFWTMADTACLGLVIGQAIGRWGNFFNREAFGGYSNSFLAMQIPLDSVYNGTTVDSSLATNVMIVDGVKYIQCHPTFLYESLWNVALFILLMVYKKHKKFRGEVFALYVAGYGIGRTWIEGMRTDQLKVGSIAVSQALSIVLVVAAIAFIIYNRVKLKKMAPEMAAETPETEEK